MTTDASDLSLTLTMTSSGTTNVAAVGGDGGASQCAAVEPVHSSSASDTDMRMMQRPPSMPRPRNRSSSCTSTRRVRRSSKSRSAPTVTRKPSADRLQTQVDMLEHQLAEARRMQNMSERQVAHVASVAQAEQTRARDMHQEARHYAVEAMQHHQSAVHRAHQTAQVSASMSQTVDKLKDADRNARLKVNQLEKELASSNARQTMSTQEVAMAQSKYHEVASSLLTSTTSDAHKGAELRAQTELVDALRCESRDRLSEVNALGKWLQDYQSRFVAVAHAEEQFASRMLGAEHQSEIESSIARSTRDSLQEWASHFGVVKQELENYKEESRVQAESNRGERLALLQERNEHYHVVNSSNEFHVVNNEYQQALVAIQTVAEQRDLLDERQAALYTKYSEMNSRCSELQSSLSRAYNLNSQLELQLDYAGPNNATDDGNFTAGGIGPAAGTGATKANGISSATGTDVPRAPTKDMILMKKITEWKPTVPDKVAKAADKGDVNNNDNSNDAGRSNPGSDSEESAPVSQLHSCVAAGSHRSRTIPTTTPPRWLTTHANPQYRVSLLLLQRDLG